MNRLARIPLAMLAPLALLLALAPFRPEPHLWEKLKLLAAGGLYATLYRTQFSPEKTMAMQA